MINRTIDATIESRPFSAEGDDQKDMNFSPKSISFLLANDSSMPKQTINLPNRRNLASEGLRYRSMKRSTRRDNKLRIFNRSTQPSFNDVFSSKFIKVINFGILNINLVNYLIFYTF